MASGIYQERIKHNIMKMKPFNYKQHFLKYANTTHET